MLKRMIFLFLTGLAFGTVFVLGSATCHAQNTRNNTDKARDLLDEYSRKPLDYGESENDARDKAARLCDKYGDLISGALDNILQQERYNCHMDPQCKKNAKEK